MENGSSLKYYRGSCHCSLFQFTLNIAPLTTVWTCSCSVCTRNGYLWIYPVEETQFVITAGNEKALHSYQFSMRGTNHLVGPRPFLHMSGIS
ncbi:hypothetical protein B0O99DRAFT_195088 [Bisporella sp. PMI_857]|nr:hypothetical protein B0O99DRAFT_195088 [Bisporella sp. PMI_857]